MLLVVGAQAVADPRIDGFEVFAQGLAGRMVRLRREAVVIACRVDRGHDREHAYVGNKLLVRLGG